MESARLIAGLARYAGGDIELAEELAQDAVVAALEQWPNDGVPAKPGAWLMTVAKRGAVALFRRNRDLERKYAEIGRDLTADDDGTADFDRAISDDIDDDLLRLIFTACHPVLPVQARVALTLRLLGGLTTAEIARAYLMPEPTIAQRIVRAKKTLASAHVPFETPDGQARPARLASVLEVIYLIFNEGYSATAGDDWMRPALCHEALRLGRILAELAPDEPEVHGLVALMEIQSSRLAARTGPSGEPVLLLDQDRGPGGVPAGKRAPRQRARTGALPAARPCRGRRASSRILACALVSSRFSTPFYTPVATPFSTLLTRLKSNLCSTRCMSEPTRPQWWPYPAQCPAGHPWGPGLVIVSWTPCACPGALTHPGLGHQCLRCGTAGCTAAWYQPN